MDAREAASSSTMTSLSADIVEHMNNIGLGTIKLASSMDKINDIAESQTESGLVRNAPFRRSSCEYKPSEFVQQPSKHSKSPIFGLRSKEKGTTKAKVEKKKALSSASDSGSGGRRSIGSYLRRSNSGRPEESQEKDE